MAVGWCHGRATDFVLELLLEVFNHLIGHKLMALSTDGI